MDHPLDAAKAADPGPIGPLEEEAEYYRKLQAAWRFFKKVEEQQQADTVASEQQQPSTD